MHSKIKGNIGVLAVATELSKNNINVFIEAGDLSKIDIIAENKGKIARLQIKSIESKNDLLKIKTLKSGPNNYLNRYKENDFDFFVIYVRNLNKIYVISSQEATKNANQITFRISEPKNKQISKIRMASDYEGIGVILKFLNI